MNLPPGTELFEVCDRCRGRGYVMDFSALPDPHAENPPANQWCSECDRRGWVLTSLGREVAYLVGHMAERRTVGATWST